MVSERNTGPKSKEKEMEQSKQAPATWRHCATDAEPGGCCDVEGLTKRRSCWRWFWRV